MRARSGMMKGKFLIRLAGAVIGAVGFLLLAYQQTVFGTALVGIGSLIIAVGE